MSNADLTAIIDGDTKGLVTALGDATDKLNVFQGTATSSLKKVDDDFASLASSIKETMGEVKTALTFAAPFAALSLLHDQLEAGIKDWTKIGDAADKAALSTDFFQTLTFKAAEAHIETDKLADGLNKFAQQLAEIKHGHGDFYDWLKDNDGTLLKALQGVKTVDDGVKALSDAMGKSDNVVEKSRLSIQAFGKDHRDLYRVLGDGADALSKAAEEARRYGVIVDESVIRKAQESKDGVSAVSNVLMTEFRTALLNIAPLLQDVGRMAVAMATGMRELRDAVSSSASAMSDAGLDAQLKSHTKNLADLEAQLERLQSGKGAGGFLPSWLGGPSTDDDKITETLKKKQEELAFIKQFQDEIDKRKKESADRSKALTDDFFSNNGEEKDKDKASKLLEGQRAMDELMKKYYTDTHQYYQAIEADAQKEKDRFKQLLEEKKITAQQYQIAMVLIAKDEATKIEEAYDHTREHIKQAMSTLSSEFEKIFQQWQSGQKVTLASIEKDLAQTIERMVLKAAVLEPLFGTGKTGPGEFGLVGDTAKSVMGGGFSLSSIFGKLFHDGGVVGSGGAGRMVSPSTFAGAVRYHEGGIAGLLPGEVPAILQQGETVIPKGQSALGGGHTFNINIQTPNPGAFKESQGQIAAMLSRAVAQGNRNL
jgi:hypothetical protein